MGVCFWPARDDVVVEWASKCNVYVGVCVEMVGMEETGGSLQKSPVSSWRKDGYC
jgi:hypothetical protein